MWIELHQSVREHPKILKVAKDLGIEPVVVLGHVISLWTWVLTMAPDGCLDSFEDDDIEHGAQWKGLPGTFVAALVRRRLIDHINGGRHIHDWPEWSGSLKAARRAKASRERKKAKDGPEKPDSDLVQESTQGDIVRTDAHKCARERTSAQTDKTDKTDRQDRQTETKRATPQPRLSLGDFRPEDPPVKLANLLLGLILTRKPDYKQPSLDRWVVHVDRMIRLDKRDPQRIEAVIRWAQADSFWQSNILSTETLREKFDKLEMQMETRNGQGNRKPTEANRGQASSNPPRPKLADQQSSRGIIFDLVKKEVRLPEVPGVGG